MNGAGLKRNFYLAMAGYVVWIVAFSFWVYYHEKSALYTQLDLALENAALTTPLLLPEHFHHQNMSASDVSPEQDRQNILKLSGYTRDRDIVYIYSFIMRDKKILFTSSSATDEELKNDSQLSHYWDHYDDADPRILAVFANQQKAFLEYTDQWGSFRSVFIPLYAEDGGLYVVGADLDISHINALLKGYLYESLIISLLFVLMGIPLVITHSMQSRQLAETLKLEVDKRTKELVDSKNRINSILEHSPVGIFHYDTESTLTTVNRQFEELIGANKDILIGFNMLENLTDPQMLHAVRESLSGRPGYFEGVYTSVTGHKTIFLHADFVPIFDADNNVSGGVGVFNDMTQQQQSTERLKKLSLAVECSPNSIVITDVEGVIEYVNPKFEQVTGYSAAESIGQKPGLYKSGETPRALYKELWETIKAGQEWRGEFHNRRKNGELFWVQSFIAPITDDAGEITHFVSIQEDVSEAKDISSKLAYQTSHDILTGLINRSEFEARLSRVVRTAQKTGTKHVLLFLDLDQFKIINDTCGHTAGDELLRQLGALLYQHLRQRDTIGRIGGDEFAILIEHCGLQQAMSTANEIRNLVEQFQFLWEEHTFTIAASIGLAQIDEDTESATETLKQADSACYAAKSLGRNRVHVYQFDDEQMTKQEGEFHWVNQIRQALLEDRFLLYVQPIVSLSDDSQTRIYEVLLRLKSTSGEIVPPGMFLPAAERYNLSDRIDRWVIDHTFNWLKTHQHQLGELDHLAINLSGPSLGDDALLGHIINQINVMGLSASQIKFEITETAAISNLREAQIFIKSLREFGCMFALDDFGSGLSSFAYLKNLQVDALKIDGVFVKDILDDPIDEAMVKSINEIGHLMGMKTIAEFVENDEIKQQLTLLGIDYAQGYAIGKPVPIQTILDSSIIPKTEITG